MKNILVCIDGSSYGQVCTQYAVWLSKHLDAKVTALYVSELWQYETPLIADFGGTLGTQPYLGLTAQLKEIENSKAKVIGEYVKKQFADAGIAGNVEFEHRSGLLVDCIDEFENQRGNIDFIVLGKRGENANLAKGQLGSNMERVIRASKLPCFVANRKFIEQKKILLAYDGSASATKALNWIANTKAFPSSEIHIVSVGKPGAESDAAKLLIDAEAFFKGTDKVPICQALSGAPGEAIEQYVVENGMTALLMGAYGHSRIRQFIIGSTTTELVRRCLVPVVMFR
ncbi:MAG TPA: universal stress protein [Candidatus Spyradosoma merdigallinarum]|uniref:Universal stress protein n=1 Tax=Candidatus Spyradosoma merdigallinarum TaxID=2840950 RepID=A0A9D1NKV1_9BACT|nr:universal stress protein [Candidatus Spyradosoma merdigallinarum]